MSNHVIRWKMVYYKPKDEWKLNHMMWDDKIELLFDEVGVSKAAK